MSNISVSRLTFEDFVYELADDQFDRDYFEILVNDAQLTRLHEMRELIDEAISEIEKVNDIEERENVCLDCLYHNCGSECDCK